MLYWSLPYTPVDTTTNGSQRALEKRWCTTSAPVLRKKHADIRRYDSTTKIIVVGSDDDDLSADKMFKRICSMKYRYNCALEHEPTTNIDRLRGFFAPDLCRAVARIVGSLECYGTRSVVRSSTQQGPLNFLGLPNTGIYLTHLERLERRSRLRSPNYNFCLRGPRNCYLF